MTPSVRAFRPEDAEAVAATRRATVPYLVCTAEALLWQVRSAPVSQRLRWLIAEDTGPIAADTARARATGDAPGTLVGCADVGLVAGSGVPRQGFLNVAVPPDKRGAGAGDALVAAGEAYLTGLGAARAHTWVADDSRALRFAEARGYLRTRPARFLGLDLTRAPLPGLPDPLPKGLSLRTAADFGEDLGPLYEADMECAADEPGDVPVGAVPYEEWLRLNWSRPDWDARLSTVALIGGEVAAYSVAQVDGVDRFWSGMTGTRRAFRGRGLARLVKLGALLRARAAGYTRAFTGNDAANAPMLAVNNRLGYTDTGSEWRCVKPL